MENPREEDWVLEYSWLPQFCCKLCQVEEAVAVSEGGSKLRNSDFSTKSGPTFSSFSIGAFRSLAFSCSFLSLIFHSHFRPLLYWRAFSPVV